MEYHATITRPWASRAFLAACIVCLITFAAHSAAHLSGEPPSQDETHARMMELVKTHKLTLPGGERTFGELHTGFSWHFGLSFLAIGAGGLALLPRARRDASLLRTLSILSLLTLAAYLAVSLIYFFIIPTAFESLAAILFALAAATAGKSKAPGTAAT